MQLKNAPKTAVIIPAFNEAQSIEKVIRALPSEAQVIVVDNGSTDKTFQKATAAGATVLKEAKKGYGHACLKGIASLQKNPPEILVFLDGDFSDYPEDLPTIIAPILNQQADFVVGTRTAVLREKGAPTDFWQWFGLLVDAFALQKQIYRFRSVPSHTLGSTGFVRDERQNLWMDHRNAT